MTARLRAVPPPPAVDNTAPEPPPLTVDEVCWLELAVAHLDQLAERAPTTRSSVGDVVLLTAADARWVRRTAVRLDLLAEMVGT